MVNINTISMDDSNYPVLLSKISNAPKSLHVLGNSDILHYECIAIVGSRNASKNGLIAARKIASEFAKQGFVIVSGLANGIDTAAHLGALDVGGLTVAVLGNGLDSVYPYCNRGLADRIVSSGGALVSEYSVGVKVSGHRLFSRNRIQSGLSMGVVVVECGLKSGTMHTVNFCRSQDRVLMVYNCSVDGNSYLISNGMADVCLGVC